MAPGNAGTATEPKVRNVKVAATDIAGLVRAGAAPRTSALTIIGPETPLVMGVVDAFQAAGLACFGPSRAAAQLEGSKAYCKEFLRPPRDSDRGLSHLHARRFRRRLAARATDADRHQGERARGRQGRGDRHQHRGSARARSMTCSADASAMRARRWSSRNSSRARKRASSCIADGTHALPCASSQDHKRLSDGDSGPQHRRHGRLLAGAGGDRWRCTSA